MDVDEKGCGETYKVSRHGLSNFETGRLRLQ